VAAAGGIEIVNLAAFRRDIARARQNVRDLTKVLKAAGAPPLARAKARAPHVTGALAASGKVSASRTTGKLIFGTPYAPRAAYARTFGRWGPPPRFGAPDLISTQDQMMDILTKGIADILTVYGWAQGTP